MIGHEKKLKENTKKYKNTTIIWLWTLRKYKNKISLCSLFIHYAHEKV